MSSARRRPYAYSKLLSSEFQKKNTEEVDGTYYIDEQFRSPPSRFPWKTVLFIMGFMVVGATCLAFGIMTSTGYFDEKYADRSWPLLILGILMFIPGGYYGYILVCICLNRDGFTLEDIPVL